ncbi:hypothetical protein CROQUDRAFT_650839 [Cronartium quercuum f. sp. fusiforme G11]|uniref:tRNA-splicing endonuclease subunit Sen54 N-terminal domain-containing protein n=1 Tax=Cronartium quercuum f. sp. fusiforme G11 TaxID=708437 RepID=A0A9P6NYF6_9BASI|nr:hypothetical protein CROQUDRAFT_650839 [Cronartium quercuum f. sp. fusiforme G11]
MEPLRDDDDAGEEEAPDWQMLARFIKSHTKSVGPSVEAFIPRRGEKDFEPVEAHAEAQRKALTQSREALFSALSAGIRGHSSRDHVQCIWSGAGCMNEDSEMIPRDRNAIIPAYVQGVAKGVLFSSIGSWNRHRKRLELMPEELLYLIERGTVECWTEENAANKIGSLPMSVEWAWGEIIGTGGLTLERYQVYGYLKRLGYIVLRKQHVDRLWSLQSSAGRISSSSPSCFTRFQLFLSAAYNSIVTYIHRLRQSVWHWSRGLFTGKVVGAAVGSYSLLRPGPWSSYDSIFEALRVIPSGSTVSAPPIAKPHSPLDSNQGYEVFYYVYKPNSRFPKTAPPTPDFEVCVVNAENMPIPTIGVMTELLNTTKPADAPVAPVSSAARSHSLSTPQKWSFASIFTTMSPKPNWRARPNIYAKLKRGERNVLLAVVDHGVTSFLRFAETDFGSTPLVGSKN